MPRLIPNQSRSSAITQSPSSRQRVEDYSERVAKYIPAEIVAAYLAVQSLVTLADGAPAWSQFVVYAALVALTPVYLVTFGGPVPRKTLQAVIGTVSFIVWTYGIGGAFFWSALEAALHHRVVYPSAGGMLLIVWVLVIGLVRPN